MAADFDRSELLTIITSSLDGLEAKHPKDRAVLSIIRKSAEQLAEAQPSRIVKAKAPLLAQDKETKTASGNKATLGDQIDAASDKIFGTEFMEPATVQSLLPFMRKAVSLLPAEDHPAKVAITRAFVTRKDKYESFPGERARDPMRWFIKR